MFGRNEVLRMNILIAGGTGYIGSHICVELQESVLSFMNLMC